MINSGTEEYYRSYYGAYLNKYFRNKSAQDTRLNYIIAFIIICILVATLLIAQPLFAQVDPGGSSIASQEISAAARCDITDKESPPGEKINQKAPPNVVTSQEMFEKNIRAKYNLKSISFPAKGIAHIKAVKYIKQKPIKINIVEINTNVNPNLKIKPQIAGQTLNTKTTVRNIANKENAIIAVNGGFFKPQTGVPLGALVIDGKVLTGPIYNRVGIGFFETSEGTNFAMDKVGLDITAYTSSNTLKIDNINQPRMSQAYTLLYTSEWGNMSPMPTKDGYNMLIQNNKITKISANPIPIGENEFVISSSKEKISAFAKEKDVKLIQNITGQLKNADHIIAAGPYLVKNSEVFVDVKTQKFQAIAGKNPRSAIGYTNEGNLVIVTVDGREQASVGMTLNELAYLMKSLGCKDAMNFDGGSSSALYVKNRIVNDALNKEGALVSNSLIIKQAEEYVQISSLN